MVIHAAPPAAANAGRSSFPVADPILASKITVPGVPALTVQRPRISELLARGTRWSPLTVVTGPPGSGKTMALTLWAAESGPVAWVALDRHDNDPEAFWSYLVAALRRAGADLPEALPAYTQEQATDHVFLLWLVSALAGQDQPVILVLDDFQVLTEPEVLKGLDFVLRNVGSGLRVVVSSRTDPPLRLHRYRLTGELAEIRASDLAFSLAEAGLLLGQYHGTISGDSLECLTQRTEGWAAGLRLAAISMDTHPDPDQFVKELVTEDSALTGYLVDEVLNTQPPEVQEVLLRTSILDQISPEAASEMAGNERAAGILPALARANTFVEPIGSGWYRYHPLFAEVLRLKLRLRYPEQVPDLHRRAARLHERNGSLGSAVRHAARAGDWQLAASIVIDGLAITEIMEPQRGQSLASAFSGMPDSEVWDEPQPYLVSAAAWLASGERVSCAAALVTAEAILARLPADQEIPSRLAAAMLCLAVSRHAGDLPGAAAAAARAEALVSTIPGALLARNPGIRAQLLAARGVAELFAGHLDEAACVLDRAVATAAASAAREAQDECLGYLALAEALRGRLSRAAQLGAQAAMAVNAAEPHPPVRRPNPAAAVAMALVHLERTEFRETHRLLEQADAALGARPDKLTGTVAWLVAARADLAEGRAHAAAQCLAKARSGGDVPEWLEQRLTQAESQARLAAATGRRRDKLPAARNPPVPDLPAIVVVESLTQREREVLQHVSAMLGTAEVASEMYISVNTVKTHLKSIFRKLAATHRREAVRRAQQLGLI